MFARRSVTFHRPCPMRRQDLRTASDSATQCALCCIRRDGTRKLLAKVGASMPIRPQLRFYYPIDWPQLSAVIRFGRAKGRCEHCGRPHGQVVEHLGDGRWWDAERQRWRDGRGRLAREPIGASHGARPRLSWPPPISTMIRPTTRRRTSRLCARGATLCTTARSTCAAGILTYRSRRAVGDLFLGRYQA